MTQININDFMTGIPMQRLPQTIQDAIQVSHFLGLQFIWVDALCIIQDSPEDWKAEAMRMADVYENSLITIAASGASSCHEGLFSARDALMETPCQLFRISPELSMFAMLEESEFPGSIQMKVGQEALYKRGWVMQERIFARRTLHFGQGVHWECRSGDCSEIGGWQYSDPQVTYLRPKEIFNVRFAPLRKVSSQNDLEDGGLSIDFLRAWDQLIRHYPESGESAGLAQSLRALGASFRRPVAVASIASCTAPNNCGEDWGCSDLVMGKC
ncbi:hypothetical protein DL770_005226 [Monosporascus sp. CRB-9-2]|nr:hypothetical protein DL770_005226 [Monosporascus sp. CRB-9-2]